MRAKSAILLVIALGCGLVAAIGVTQVISKGPEPSDQQGDMRSIVVATKDIAPGELITPQMVALESWPKEKAFKDSLSDVAKVDGCRARDEIYQGEQIRERKLLGRGFTRRTATDYIPKGYRVVGVKVDVVSGGAGLIQPGDRVDVVVYFNQDLNRGVTENRTQTILQDIKVFAVDDVFKIDPGADERDSVQAKVIQLLVTPQQAESLVLAQQLGKVQLTMRPPSGEDVITTPGKTPAELLGQTSAGNRAQEGSSPNSSAAGQGSLLDFLNAMKSKPAATTQPDQTAPTVPANSWNVRVLSGSELNDVMMEESVDATGEHVWRIVSADASEPEPPAAGQPPAPQPPAPPAAAPGPPASQDAAPPSAPAPDATPKLQSTLSGQPGDAAANPELPEE